MANLTFLQKQLIEDVFRMGGGFFLDLSNREFSELMRDIVPYNLYERYGNLSKAKLFRAFCEAESQQYVGKAIIVTLNYMSENNMLSGTEKEQKLKQLGLDLLGKSNSPNRNNKKASPKSIDHSVNYIFLTSELLSIESLSTQQAKGYAFEKYLNLLFDSFNLSPKASYKTDYDQIDGSFVLNGNTILLEAKYRNSTISKDDLILFENKVTNKSHYVRGLFVSFSHVDKNALEYFKDSSARFVILYVEELFMLCNNNIDLVSVLNKKYRVLDETGEVFFPINKM